MKSASQMVVLMTVLATLLSFTIGLPTKHRSADKFVKATDPSQKTGDYIVVLKEGATNRAEGGPSFISIMLQGIANYNEEKEENYSGEIIVKKFQDLGFFMFSVDMNEVALEKVLECSDVEMVEETMAMKAPNQFEEEEENSSGYGITDPFDEEKDHTSGYGYYSPDEDEDEGGLIFFG